jgi:hypothetical protein
LRHSRNLITLILKLILVFAALALQSRQLAARLGYWPAWIELYTR